MSKKEIINEHWIDIDVVEKHLKERKKNTEEIADLFKPGMSIEDIEITQQELEMQGVYDDNQTAKEILFEDYLQEDDQSDSDVMAA